MKFLKNLFNRQTGIYVGLDSLAALVAPLHPSVATDSSPANIAKGWAELTDWARIGFDREQNKGTHYLALNVALRKITQTISSAERTGHDGAGLYLTRDDLEVLRATYWQMAESANGLRLMAKHMRKLPEMRIVTEDDGSTWATPDFTNVIQIYNRPQEDHVAAAAKLEECRNRMDTFFGGGNAVRPARDAKVLRYAEFSRLYN